MSMASRTLAYGVVVICLVLTVAVSSGCGSKEVAYEVPEMSPEEQARYEDWRQRAEEAAEQGKPPPLPPMPEQLQLKPRKQQ